MLCCFCNSCLRIFSIGLNFLYIIFGLGFIGIFIIFKWGLSFLLNNLIMLLRSYPLIEKLMVNGDPDVSFIEKVLTSNLLIPSIICLIIGILLVILGLVGCISSCCPFKPVVYTYIGMFSIICVLYIMAIIGWFATENFRINLLKVKLKEYIKFYFFDSFMVEPHNGTELVALVWNAAHYYLNYM